MIEQAEAQELVVRAISERNEALAKAEALGVHIQGLERFIQGLTIMYPDLEQGPVTPPQSQLLFEDDAHDSRVQAFIKRASDSNVRVTDAVRSVLSKNPDRWYSGREMIVEVRKLTPSSVTPTSVRLALRRSADKGFSVRKDDERGQVFRLNAAENSAEVSTP